MCIHFRIRSQAPIIASATNRHRAWMVVQFYAVAVDTIQRKSSSRSDAIANSIGVAMLSVTHVLASLKSIHVNKKRQKNGKLGSAPRDKEKIIWQEQ